MRWGLGKGNRFGMCLSLRHLVAATICRIDMRAHAR